MTRSVTRRNGAAISNRERTPSTPSRVRGTETALDRGRSVKYRFAAIALLALVLAIGSMLLFGLVAGSASTTASAGSGDGAEATPASAQVDENDAILASAQVDENDAALASRQVANEETVLASDDEHELDGFPSSTNASAIDSFHGGPGGDWSTLYAAGARGQSATVVDGVVYVAGGSVSETWLYAFDAHTGTELWSQQLESAQRNGGHAPTVVNGTVYVGGDWELHAFDAETGEEEWTEFIGTRIRTAPTVYDEYVLFGTAGGSLRSHHAENGTQAWSYSVDDAWASTDTWGQSEHSSVTVVDGTVYATGITEIHALEVDDPGEEPTETDKRWSWETPNEGNRDDRIVGALTVLDGTAFVHVNTFEGVGVFDGQAHSLHSSSLVALDDEDGSERWIYDVDHKTGFRGTASPTAVGTQGGDATVYFHANDDVLYAIDAGDGSLEWQTPNLYSSFATSSPTVTDDRVYVGSSTFDDFGNGVFVVDRSTGHQVDFHSTGDYRVTSSPIVVDGVVYGTGSRLVAHGNGGKLFATDVSDDGSSVDSRVLQATLNHHDFWTGADRGDVDVVDATLEQEAILQNDSMAVNATFRNYGSAAVEHNSTLRIGEYRTLHTPLSIDEYDERTETLGSNVTEIGTYEVSVDDADVGTLHVVDPDEPVYLAEGELVDDVVWVERDVEVNATFVNIGSVGGEYEANVTANGVELDTGSFNIDANDSKTTVLAGTVSEPGTYEIAIDGDPIGTVEVLADPTFLVDGTVVNERVLVDETVDARLDLRNLAGHPETHEATLAVDGVASTNTSYSLDANEEATENASVTVDETGLYNVSYGNESLGSVEVLSEAIHLLDTDLVDRDLPTAYPDEDVEIALYYENVASTDREHQITVTADEDPAVETNVTLAAHDREMIFVNVTGLEEGVYDLAVNDEPIETLYVGPYDHFIFENNSIQSVLDNATANDRLGVASGVYEESLTVDTDGVSISNFAGEEPVLDGMESVNRAITVDADDVHVEGFTIIRFVGDTISDASVYVESDATAFEFRENNVTDNRKALFFWDGDGSVIANNSISDNEGTAFESVSNSDMTVTGNTISDNAGSGIVDDGTTPGDWLISGNTIVNNTGGGIFTDLVDSEISHNLVADNDGGGIYVWSRNAVTDNVVTDNSDDEGVMTGGISTAVDATIANNTVTDVDGTGIDPSARAVVRNNTVSDAGMVGIEVGSADVKIIGNDLSGHEADLRFDSGYSVYNASVTNNTFETGIEIRDVDDTLDERPHSMDNNTVNGAPLFYAANVSDPDIDPDAGQVILVNVTNATISGFEFGDVVAGVQLSHVEDVVVSDNEFRDIETRFLEDTGVIGVWHSSSTTIDNNTIEDVDRTGIGIYESTELTVSANDITNGQEDGIRVAGFTSERNTIEGNLISGASTGIDAIGNDDGSAIGNDLQNTQVGISYSGDGAEVSNNTVEVSDDHGISVSGDEIVVSHNTVTDSDGEGISVSGREGTTVSWNTVTGSDGLGLEVEVDDAGSIVEGNTVRSNDEGLHLTGHGNTAVENTDVTGNVVEDNVETGIIVDGSDGVTVTNNDISGNDVGLDFDAGFMDHDLNATANWWGADSGPSGGLIDPETNETADGAGDSIVDVVDDRVLFDPWLDEPIGEPIEEPHFDVSIDDTNEPVDAGEILVVNATVTNEGAANGSQTVGLEDFDGVTVDSTNVALDDGENRSVTLEWETDEADVGTDEVTVRSDDDSDATTVEVLSRPDPTVEIVSVVGHSEDAGVVYASDDPLVELEATAPGDVESVTVLVDSLATSFSVVANATHEGGDVWSATIPLSDVPDDGQYELTAVAVDDEGLTADDDADEILEIDREAPSLAATFGGIDGVNATVTVSSPDDLLGEPTAAIQYPSGATATLNLTDDGDEWTDEIELNESGEYAVAAAGIDRAGNVGMDNASIVAHTDLTIEDGDTVVNNDTGTMIEFATNDTAEDAYVAFSEGAIAHQPLEDDQLGVHFLTADLDDDILDELENATIYVPVNASAIDPVDPEDVSLSYYNESADPAGWEPVDTTVEEINGTEYWVATVEHFSTYGVIASDETSPEIQSFTPGDGETLPDGTEITIVTVEYADELSGIDVASVALSIDGVDVTGDANTSITSSTAEHVLAVEDGESYEATVSVADHAGNVQTKTVTFSVDEEDDGGFNPPPPPPPSDEPAEFVLSSLDLSATSVLEGETVTVSATVENVGDETGDYEVVLEVNGEVVATETVTLAGGASETITFEHGFDEPGEFDVSVDGDSVDVVTVEAAVDDDDDADEDADDDADDEVGDDDADDTDDGLDGTDDVTDDSDGTDDETEDGADDLDDGTPGFGILATLLAVLVGVGRLLQVRRAERFAG